MPSLSNCLPFDVTVRFIVTLLKAHGGGMYCPTRITVVRVTSSGDPEGEMALTNKWRIIRVGKDISHEGLRIDTSILIACARWRQNWLGHLKVDKGSGRSLPGLPRIVRSWRRERIGCAMQHEDIQAEATTELDHSMKHDEVRRLCAVSAIWQSDLLCHKENILERRRTRSGSLGGGYPSRR